MTSGKFLSQTPKLQDNSCFHQKKQRQKKKKRKKPDTALIWHTWLNGCKKNKKKTNFSLSLYPTWQKPYLDVLQHAHVANISTAPRHKFDPTLRLPLLQLMGHVKGPGQLQQCRCAGQRILRHTGQRRSGSSYYNVAIWKGKWTQKVRLIHGQFFWYFATTASPHSHHHHDRYRHHSRLCAVQSLALWMREKKKTT